MKGTHNHGVGASRRAFFGTAVSAGAMLGAGCLYTPTAHAHGGDEGRRDEDDAQPKPIPGGVAPLAPFGIFIHHNPLNPAVSVADINDPSQITDFHGFVGLTHIRGGGTGRNTVTGATMPLAYQTDMGFAQGVFLDLDGHRHRGTFAFV